MSTQDKLAQAVPQGWKLVPVEPTHDMISAGNDSDPDSLDWVGPEAFWAAMLAAAPQPDAQAAPCLSAHPNANRPHRPDDFCPEQRCGSAGGCMRALAQPAAKPAAPQPEAQAVQVAWRTFDGEGGYDYRAYDGNEDYAAKWDAASPNHKGWVERLYTIAAAPQPEVAPAAPQAGQQADQVECTLTRALRRIEAWDECDAAFRVDHGSNGERNYYRAIARSALAAWQASSLKVIRAAQAVVARWDSPLWRQEVHTAELINDLREAIASQLALPECTRSHPHEEMSEACQKKVPRARADNAAVHAAIAAQQAGQHAGWPDYVAGIIVAYLGGSVDDERIKPIAGIIERRLWVLRAERAAGPAHQPAAQQDGGDEVRARSPTAGMSIAQRILHVGGRNNAAGYVEFGSTQAVQALVRQVLRDLPGPAYRADLDEQPLGAILNGRVYARRLEAEVRDLEAGPLTACSDWVEFRRCFEHLAQWAQGAAPADEELRAIGIQPESGVAS